MHINKGEVRKISDISDESVSNQLQSMRSSSGFLMRRPTFIRAQRSSIDLGRPSILESSPLSPARDKKWQAVQCLLQGDMPPAEYYESLPFQPGFGFFKPFLKACIQSGESLQFTLPEFLLLHQKPLWVQSAGTRVVLKRKFSMQDFLQAFAGPGASPAAVLRMPEKGVCMRSIPLSGKELQDLVSKQQLPELGMIQKYVKSVGERPTMVRLFYVPRPLPGKGSKAIAIVSSEQVSSGSYSGRYLVRTNAKEGVTFTVLQSSAAAPYLRIGRQICALLEQHYRTRLTDIAFDLIHSGSSLYSLLSCHSFHIDPSIPLSKSPVPHKPQEEVHCTACRLPYSPLQVSNFLPYKLLLVYKARGERGRTVLALPHLRAVNEDLLTHLVKLCDVCYFLVLAEMELMEVEARLASGLSIEVKEIDPLHLGKAQKPAYLPSKLRLFRLFLYIKSVKVPENADWSLKYKLFGQSLSKTSGQASFAALFYILCPVSPSPFPSLSISFTIKCPEQKLTGDLKPLQHWHRASEVFREDFRVDLYAGDWTKGEIGLTVGLSQEGEIETSRLEVGLRRWQGLYLPEGNCYFDGRPLPVQWLEALEPSYCLKATVTPKNLVGEESGYTPLLDLDRYLLATGPKVPKSNRIAKKRAASLTKASVMPEKEKTQLSAPRLRAIPESEPLQRPQSFDSTDLSASVARYLQGKWIPAIERLKQKVSISKAAIGEVDSSMETLSLGTSATTVELLPRPRSTCLPPRKAHARAVSARVIRAACLVYR